MIDPLIELYRQAEDYFFKAISSKFLQFGNDATAYMTGVPVADLNLVYVKKNITILHNILRQSKQFYGEDNLGFVVIIPDEFCTSEATSILKNEDYFQNGKCVAMSLNLKDLTMDNSIEFDDETIIRANDDRLNDWLAPLIAFPATDLQMCIKYANTHTLALKKKLNLYHFSLYKQEKVIASITLSLHNGLARIDDLGTLPEFQSKGYATRLMIYVLLEAKKLGAHYCFLESSDSGFTIYQKLGFQTLFINNIYSKIPN